MAPKLRIAIAQTCPVSAPEGVPASTTFVHGDPFPTLTANLRESVRYVEDAVKQGVDLVMFPEYWLQGIVNEHRQYLTLASRHLESFIARLAKEHSVAIVGTIVHGVHTTSTLPTSDPFAHIPLRSSAAEADPTSVADEWRAYLSSSAGLFEADKSAYALENEAFFLDRAGNLGGKYVKRNLWHPERDYMNAGTTGSPVFETEWGKAGFLICWDLSHPGAVQAMVDQGADLILMPSYWLAIDSEPMLSRHNPDPDYELSVVQALAWARAFESETVLAMVNAGGPRDEGFMGGSGVWAPLLGKVGGFAAAEVGLRVVDVDLGILKDGRETYKIREDWSGFVGR
ncbi:hypothetical protein Q5752_005056 [Cryptotrichosporon argae]